MESLSVRVVSVDVDGELDRLKQEHSELEKRLRELDGHISLTMEEQTERSRLKKEKLRTKDRMCFLLTDEPLTRSAGSAP